ncbi:TlpA family protein disulfide reductase, partial [Planctomycetota bacterium]
VINGKYNLNVSFLEEINLEQGLRNIVELGGYFGTIEVPQMEEEYLDEPLDLGDLELKMYNPLEVGNVAPLFEAKTVDGNDLRLIDYRGKFVLISSWMPAYYPELQELKDIYETCRNDEQFALIGFSSNDTLEEVQKQIREDDIAWPQIYLGEDMDSQIAYDYGQYGLTWAFLIDREGRIVERKIPGGNFSEFKSAVMETIKEK